MKYFRAFERLTGNKR